MEGNLTYVKFSGKENSHLKKNGLETIQTIQVLYVKKIAKLLF